MKDKDRGGLVPPLYFMFYQEEEAMTKTKDAFYSQIWKLVLPILIQNLLSSMVSSADVIMLSAVDQDSISAVSLASQYATILFSVFYGLFIFCHKP